MNVRLIWITPEAEQVVGYCARVSNPANQENPDVSGLLRYCIKHGHWSIFEMASMCLEIETTRAISPQLLRHKSFAFQEFSQRYAEALDVAVPDLRRQDSKNRQNSIDDLDPFKKQTYLRLIQTHNAESVDLYEELLRQGVAKECARSVLPLSTKTRLYMSGTLRSWLHYCDLRCGNGTQLEHQAIAERSKQLLMEQCPSIGHAMWPESVN